MRERSIFGGMLLVALAPVFAVAQVGLNGAVESAVQTRFADTPVMIDIARCESRFRQFTDTGNPLYGGYERKMVGVFQIYEDVHAEYAKSIGMDIYTLEGNLTYAKHLYAREGTQPWLSSFPCWGKEINVPGSDAPADALTLNLSMGIEHPQILLLQKTLNAKGYAIASDGPGSLGSETSTFGGLTRVAVRTFQCAEMQICNGDEYSTGYGFVGARTRAALLKATPRVASEDHLVSQNVVVAPENLTLDQQHQIADLQAQIIELTKALNALIVERS